MILGLDLGSINSKAILMDRNFHVIRKIGIKSKGGTWNAVRVLLKQILEDRKDLNLKIGITGSGCEAFKFHEGIYYGNEIISLALGTSRLYPTARSVIEIGGQTSRWILMKNETVSDSRIELIDFALNERCAAGSGAFLEQQAKRIKLEMNEFSSLALSAKQGAAIAGRCSVFAKSDMIHLQQKGTPIEEIAYGVCLAMARNFIATILKGRDCVPPILLTGGGVRNRGIVRAFREVLKLREKDFIVASDPQFTCAIGAAFGAGKFGKCVLLSNEDSIFRFLELTESRSKNVLPSLGSIKTIDREEPSPSKEEVIEGYLGVDVGSISTNFALVDSKGEVKAGIYLPTKGRPIEVLKDGFDLLVKNCKSRLNILAMGTTGSGRYLAGRFLKSDVIHNEITCQLVGTTRYFPDVDTIFEIGGQDSKYISVKKGRINDFTMNKICAAGTGSFLEEQAEQLGIQIKGEFASLAAQSQSPCDLGCRCTVYMDTEVVNAFSRGASLPDVTAGLAYSIVRNYLEKVVVDRPIGNSIVLQGGVASNAAVVKAFSLLLNKPVSVHPYNRISGAIGAAFMAKKAVKSRGRISPDTASLERRIHQDYSVSSFQCKHCSNHCQVNQISIGKEKIYFGDICERYTSKQRSLGKDSSSFNLGLDKHPVPDLFKERENLLLSSLKNPVSPTHKIGLPKASLMFEYLPFWITFFNHVDCEVCLSPDSNMDIFEDGMKILSAETCLPVKIAYGHAQWFLKNDVDFIFFPSMVDFHKDNDESASACPYVEHLPFMIKSSIDIKFLSPCVDLNSSAGDFLNMMSDVQFFLGKNTKEFKEAFFHASSEQKEFYKRMREKGREMVEGDYKNLWVILGKPYNLHDAFLNLNLASHLKKIGVVALPIDFIPFDTCVTERWPGIPPWRYNQHILQAALWSCEKKYVYPVIVSNFGCGPDAFSLKHLSRILDNKPHLLLEFDEHRGETGLITRLEAFLDEVNNSDDEKKKSCVSFNKRRKRTSYNEYRKREFVLPYFADHAFAFSGAMNGLGMEARVLPQPDAQSLALGEQFSSGKECHPYAILAGDLIKFARSKRKGGEVFYFPGTKNLCLLSQYSEGLNYLLEDLGIYNIEALAPSAEGLFALLGITGLKLLWRGLVAVDLLVKAACEKRAYEIQKGLTDKMHKANLEDIEYGLANQSLSQSLGRCVERLRAIDLRKERRLLVGIAGDIYTRQNPVANHDLFLKLEELGCEVWPASFLVDDVNFGIRRNLSRAFTARKYHESAAIGILYLMKEMEALKVKKNLKDAVTRMSEPGYRDILKFASSYVSMKNNEIILLNVAKMVDFARHGADGVINAICFNCMLGTISEVLSGHIRKDYNNIPIPTMIFSGPDILQEKTKLEAFVFQVKQFAEKRNGFSSS